MCDGLLKPFALLVLVLPPAQLRCFVIRLVSASQRLFFKYSAEKKQCQQHKSGRALRPKQQVESTQRLSVVEYMENVR